MNPPAEAPSERETLYRLAVAQRRSAQHADALNTLQRLEQLYPRFARLFEERGLCLLATGHPNQALTALQQAVDLNDALPDSWAALNELLRAAGRTLEADNAAHSLRRFNALPTPIARASYLLNDGDVEEAERLLRAHLQQHGPHVDGMRLLAQIAVKLDIWDDAELLLMHVVAMAPDYHDARYEYAAVLSQRRKHGQALHEAGLLLAVEPDNANYLTLYAKALENLGDAERALPIYRHLLAHRPEDRDLLLTLANFQKTLGLQAEAIDSFRAAARRPGGSGIASWGLANTKAYRFTDEELAGLRAQDGDASLPLVERYHLSFALGKALEDRGEYAESFAYYARGNAEKRSELKYQPEVMEAAMRRQATVCTPAFFAALAGVGCDRPDPIFIVGLPRAGSTLLEQILATHSQVDGTMELPSIQHISHQFRHRNGTDPTPEYPSVLAGLPPQEFALMGEEYLEETRVYRGGAPFFVDKMPSNFRDLSLIHLILPNAKIIDARREPMACCFGNFKQLFANGQEFTYRLEDMARYYRNYLDLMDHWDRVLPGKVLRVHHEDVVDDLEGSVRRLLAFCGLEFEPACLEFHKTARSVRTVSSEQVRRPIYRDGLNQWRHFEPWLGPLKEALGPDLGGRR